MFGVWGLCAVRHSLAVQDFTVRDLRLGPLGPVVACSLGAEINNS